MTLEFTIPTPPSVNALWTNVKGRGRVKTPEYRQWETEAGWEIRLQIIRMGKTFQKIPGKYSLFVLMGKLRKGSDLANREKALSDLLKAHGVIEDDQHLDDLRMKWSDEVKPGWAKIILEACSCDQQSTCS